MGRKLCGYFQPQTGKITQQNTWTGLRKGNLKRKTESLLIEAQNNAITTKYIKAKIDYTQPNCKCRSCGERDEPFDQIISESSKLA